MTRLLPLLVFLAFLTACAPEPVRIGPPTPLAPTANPGDALDAIRHEFASLPRPLVQWYYYKPGHWENRWGIVSDGYSPTFSSIAISPAFRQFLASHSHLEICCAIWPLLSDDAYARDVIAAVALLSDSEYGFDTTLKGYLRASRYSQNDPSHPWSREPVSIRDPGQITTLTYGQVIDLTRTELHTIVFNQTRQLKPDDFHIAITRRPRDEPTLDSRICALAFTLFGPEDQSGINNSGTNDDSPLLPSPERMARLSEFDGRLILSYLVPLSYDGSRSSITDHGTFVNGPFDGNRIGQMSAALVSSMLGIPPIPVPATSPELRSADAARREARIQRRERIAESAARVLKSQ